MKSYESLLLTDLETSKYPNLYRLAVRHQKFVIEYLKCYNASKAAIAANYSKKTAKSMGQQLLARDYIQTAIKEIIVAQQSNEIADIAEVQEFLTSVIRGDVKDYCEWTKDGFVFTRSSNDIKDGKSRLIKKVRAKEKTSAKGDWTEVQTEVELHDPLKAVELLGKSLGMFTEKHEHSGNIGLKLDERLASALDKAKGSK